MKFVTARELRLNPGPVLEGLREERNEVVITSRGKPVALMVGISDDDLEDTVRALRRARAQLAVARLQAHSLRTGLDKMGPEEIEAEIQEARAARR